MPLSRRQDSQNLSSAVVVAAILAAASVSNGHVPPALSGVVLNADNSGGAGLEIRVSPIERDADPVYAMTDDTGAFRFMVLHSRIYILDVINGHKLLHREVVDIQKQPRLLIKVVETQ